MSPSDIAREADVLAHRICRVAGIPLSDTEMVRSISSLASEHLDALILSAAAKMVRESGAHHLEAITTDQGRLCEAVHHGKGDYHTGLAPCPVCLRIESALTALRALTEHSGKPQAGR